MQSQFDRGVVDLNFESTFKWHQELAIHKYDMGEPGNEWWVGSAWDKERQKFCLEYEAAAFVQYTKRDDGSGEAWVEACEDRLIDWELCFSNSAILGADPELVELNPEELRANDEDGFGFQTLF